MGISGNKLKIICIKVKKSITLIDVTHVNLMDMKATTLLFNPSFFLVEFFMIITIKCLSLAGINPGGPSLVNTSETDKISSFSDGEFRDGGSAENTEGSVKPGNLAATFTYSIPSTIKPSCYGGAAIVFFNVSGGTPPCEYYVVPEGQWNAGDQMYSMLYNNNFSRLGRYTFTNNSIEVEKGTATVPKVYWVAVQDKDGNGVTSGTYLLSWWKKISVYDQTGISITSSASMDLMTTCYQGSDGRVAFTISGGVQKKNGYLITPEGGAGKVGLSYDSGNKLAAGTYRFTVADSMNCKKTVTYVVNQPKKIYFTVGHTDAVCESSSSDIWISSVDASSGSGPVSGWSWHYSKDPAFTTTVSPWYSLTTKATGIPNGVYYIEVRDGNGCRQILSDAYGIKSIPVGQTHFTPVWSGNGIDVMTIYIGSASKNDEDLGKCDEVAVFDGQYCVGVAKLEKSINPAIQSSYAMIKVSRAQSGQHNGYVSAHQIDFQMWDQSTLKAVPANTVQFFNPYTGNNIPPVAFVPNGSAYVQIGRINTAPVANVGPDQTVTEGDEVTLDGSVSSDAEGDQLTFNWIAPASITLSSIYMVNPTFLAPNVKNDSIIRFSLRVNDGILNCLKPDTVQILVKNFIPTLSPVIYAKGDMNSPFFDRADSERELKIYPNPSNGLFAVSSDIWSLTGCTAEVFNPAGQLLITRIIDRDPFEISIKGFAGGWYFVKITGASSAATGKVYVRQLPGG